MTHQMIISELKTEHHSYLVGIMTLYDTISLRETLRYSLDTALREQRTYYFLLYISIYTSMVDKCWCIIHKLSSRGSLSYILHNLD